jgi:hypothetical protein
MTAEIIWRCDFCKGHLKTRGDSNGKMYVWCGDCGKGKYIDEEWRDEK